MNSTKGRISSHLPRWSNTRPIMGSMIWPKTIRLNLTLSNIWIHNQLLMIQYEHQKLLGKWLGSWVFLIKKIGTIVIIFLNNIDHLSVHKEIYVYYLTLAMLIRYQIVSTLDYEYPSPKHYFELFKYSRTW